MPQRIHYIANNPVVLPILSDYIQQFNDFDLVEYSIPECPEADYLLILEPVKIGAEFYSLSSAWKPWLMEFHPNTRLIIAAFEQSRHTNCLNLLDLPENFTAWLHNVRPVSDFRLVKTGKITAAEKSIYVDPWSFGLSKSGKNLNYQTQKYFEGHDHGNSFFAYASRIRKHLIDYSHNMHPNSSILTDLSIDLKYYNVRWNGYNSLFNMTPLHNELKSIEARMKTLEENITEINALNIQLIKNALDEVIILFKNKIKPYVFPEEYW